MAVADAVEDLAHDHADLNRRVRALGAALPALDAAAMAPFAAQLVELREILFLHFAREEEGLFPFVSETVPDLANRVDAMASQHDTICGASVDQIYADGLNRLDQARMIAKGINETCGFQILEAASTKKDAVEGNHTVYGFLTT